MALMRQGRGNACATVATWVKMVGKGDDLGKRVWAALAEKKLAALLSGELRVAGTRGDEVAAEARRLAEKIVRKALATKPASWWMEKGVDKKDAKALGKFVRGLADKYVAAHPEVTEQARKNVEEAKALGGVDLDALGSATGGGIVPPHNPAETPHA